MEKNDKWRHSMCEDCWIDHFDSKLPVRIHEKYRHIERCCFCGIPTASGIYIREDPSKTQCKGDHYELP